MLRRRWKLPAACAVAAIAVLLPSVAGHAQQAPPKPQVDKVPLIGQSASVDPGWQMEVSAHPNLVGVQWSGDASAKFTIEVRKGSGDWTPVSDTKKVDFGPQPGTAEAASVAKHGNVSEPVWVGNDVTDVRVQLDKGSAQGVTLQAVDSAPAGVSPAHQAMVAGRGIGWAMLAGLALLMVLRKHRRRFLALLAGGALLLAGCAGGGGAPMPGGIIPRTAWGGDLPWACDWATNPPQDMGTIYRAIVHHTVNSNDYGPGDSASMLRGIYAYHVFSLGYCDVAYNFFVDKYGQVFEGRWGGTDKAILGAHALDANWGSTGIALLGTYTGFTPPAGTQASLVNLIGWKFRVHNVDPRPDGAIIGHRDAGTFATECPGDAAESTLPFVRAAVRQQVPYNTPFGYVDVASRVDAGHVRVQGWALDLDTANPINVLVLVGSPGQLVANQPANLSRPDIGNAYQGYGPNHGFDITVPAVPGQQVFVAAVNVGSGAAFAPLAGQNPANV